MTWEMRRYMSNIIRTGQCENSPKNKFVEDITIAILEKDQDFIEANTSEGFELPPSAKNMGYDKILFIFFISHGKYGSLLTQAYYGEEEYLIGFRYIFENTKGKKMEKVIVTESKSDGDSFRERTRRKETI